MENKKVLAIFGGSFNPPLNSHFALAEQIINECENIEKVIFVPVSSKYEKSSLIEANHRFNMLKIVCDKNSDFLVSDIELKQTRQLYTLETLELLQKQYPNNQLMFTVGTDNLKEIPTWETGEELINRFKILVLERDKDNMDDIINSNEFFLLHKNSFIKLKENIRTNISSTFVRDKIKRQKNVRYLMPDEVYYYIKQNNLYNINNSKMF